MSYQHPVQKKLFWTNDAGQSVPYDDNINDIYNASTTSLPFYFYIGIHKHFITKDDNGDLIQVKKDPCPQSCPKCNINTTNRNRHIRRVTVQNQNSNNNSNVNVNVNVNTNINNSTGTSAPTENKNTFECPVCFDPYNNNAYIITTCGHTACISCLNQIKSANNANTLKCPICRHQFDSSTKFVNNFILNK